MMTEMATSRNQKGCVGWAVRQCVHSSSLPESLNHERAQVVRSIVATRRPTVDRVLKLSLSTDTDLRLLGPQVNWELSPSQ